jgi:hypothetical protein
VSPSPSGSAATGEASGFALQLGVIGSGIVE